MCLLSFFRRVTDVNSDYSVCSTYPPHFVVPATSSDFQVKKQTK